MSRPAYTLRYDEGAIENLRWIPRKQHSAIRRAIEEQLSYEPDVETRNRKPLKGSSAEKPRWELRCGKNNQVRVIYRVEPETRVVAIAVIGVKKGNQLLVNGAEYTP